MMSKSKKRCKLWLRDLVPKVAAAAVETVTAVPGLALAERASSSNLTSDSGENSSPSEVTNNMEKKDQASKKEIVVIHWVDSYAHSGQKAEEDWQHYGTGYAISVGILLNENEEQVTLAQDMFYDQPPTIEGDQFRNVFSIPKRCIVELQKFPCSIEYKKQEK
ncbi:MAG: hypothetical protein A2748_01165 [Candidatus Wildermuthbacteria bacterium RIFCSPHIGHO2_01_FULL_45_20]|nr:MAG: hypothetical protein A2748_01165 [Candidatus Wildermuthbacteria bacterium RIFCSPHIGHO2_01_FULL_45_20]